MAKIVFQNEEGQNLNRYVLTPVEGQANTYDLTRAANITQQGTPYNKEVGDHLLQVEDGTPVQSLPCTKSSTVYALTGLAATEGLVSCVFRADANYTEGDTFTINDVAVIAQQQNGDNLPDAFFRAGAVVSCVYDVSGAKLNFKMSGEDVKLNIFAQPDEPKTKDGLWIQTPEYHKVQNVVSKDSFSIGGNIRTPNNYTPKTLTDVDCQYAIEDMLNKKTYWLKYIRGENSDWKIRIMGMPADGSNQDITEYASVSIPRTEDGYYADCRVVGCIYNQLNANLVVWIYYTTGESRYMLLNWKLGAEQATFTQLSGLSSVAQDIFFYDKQPSQNGFYYSSLIDEMKWEIHFYNIQTGTISLIDAFNFGKPSDYVFGYIYKKANIEGDTAYLFELYQTKANTSNWDLYSFCTTNFITKTHTTWKKLSIDSSFTFFQNILFQNKALTICQGHQTGEHGSLSNLYLHNLNTLTTSLIKTYDVDGIIFGEFSMVSKTSKRIFCCNSDHQKVFVSDVFDIESEELENDTLSILSGYSQKIKLISSDKKDLNTFCNDAWWYDTDFREYPTYVGNGSAWAKIKN